SGASHVNDGSDARPSAHSAAALKGGARYLDANRLRHLGPRPIALALEPPQVDARHSKGAVVEEGGDGLDRRAGVAAELRGRVAEDVESRGLEPGGPQVTAEPRVERRAAHAAWIRACLPQRRGWLHVRQR